jgi:DNA-binding FadR family transcriptional regulator
MAIESFLSALDLSLSSAVVGEQDQPKQSSFWHRLTAAIMAGRQRKADEFVKDYLRTHAEYASDARGKRNKRST